MQWGQIKLLFIICFLILNVFLTKQLLDRDEETMSALPEESKEEELELNISGLEQLSQEIFEAPLLYTTSYNFNDVENFTSLLPSQEAVVVNDTTLYAEMTSPVKLPIDDIEGLTTKLRENVYLGGNYTRYRYIEEANLMVFFQRINFPIFYNKQAVLFVKLNDSGDMTHYMMRALDIVQEDQDSNQQKLISEYDAVYRLYHNSNILKTGDEITGIDLGYHNIVSLPNGEQLLNPTWQVNVNETKDFFINAIEGHDYPQYTDFIIETLADFIGPLTPPLSREYEYFNLAEDREEEALLASLRQAFMTTYQQLTEVNSE